MKMKETDELTKIFLESMVKAAMGVKNDDIDSVCEQFAETNMKLFKALQKVGFSKAESFEILVAFIKKVGK